MTEIKYIFFDYKATKKMKLSSKISLIRNMRLGIKFIPKDQQTAELIDIAIDEDPISLLYANEDIVSEEMRARAIDMLKYYHGDDYKVFGMPAKDIMMDKMGYFISKIHMLGETENDGDDDKIIEVNRNIAEILKILRKKEKKITKSLFLKIFDYKEYFVKDMVKCIFDMTDDKIIYDEMDKDHEFLKEFVNDVVGVKKSSYESDKFVARHYRDIKNTGKYSPYDDENFTFEIFKNEGIYQSSAHNRFFIDKVTDDHAMDLILRSEALEFERLLNHRHFYLKPDKVISESDNFDLWEHIGINDKIVVNYMKNNDCHKLSNDISYRLARYIYCSTKEGCGNNVKRIMRNEFYKIKYMLREHILFNNMTYDEKELIVEKYFQYHGKDGYMYNMFASWKKSTLAVLFYIYKYSSDGDEQSMHAPPTEIISNDIMWRALSIIAPKCNVIRTINIMATFFGIKIIEQIIKHLINYCCRCKEKDVFIDNKYKNKFDFDIDIISDLVDRNTNYLLLLKESDITAKMAAYISIVGLSGSGGLGGLKWDFNKFINYDRLMDVQFDFD